MDREDKRRYFIVGSVMLEVVTPLFRQRLEKQYSSQGLGSLQAFLNQQPVIHILFHSRYRNVWCCTDKPNCVNPLSLPLTYSQWDLLYTENPGPKGHLCHCKYTANAVLLDQLDITLSAFLLLNCCSLGPVEENAIKTLRTFKNNYLSHNTKGGITLAEYNTLWADLKTYVLQFDPSKEDDLVRIENRPLDEALCNKYFTCLLDIQRKLEELDSSIQGLNGSVQTMDTNIQGLNTTVNAMDTNIQDFIQANHGLNTSIQTIMMRDTNIQGTLQEVLHYVRRDATCQHCGRNPSKQGYTSQPYKLGQDIFRHYHQFNLKSVLNVDKTEYISGVVMMDDGRLVVCLFLLSRLLICNTDGSEVDSIQLKYKPRDVTAVNNSTVAVTLSVCCCIEMYDINNKHKLKSIPVPGGCCSITTINNKLLVGCDRRRLLMIDYWNGKLIQTIHTDCEPDSVHAAGDRIFYCNKYYNNGTNILYCYSYTDDKVTTTSLLSKLYNWYSYTDDKVTTTTLPCTPWSITSLQDGSQYVLCNDGSVQHVSSDGQHYKPVTTEGLKSLRDESVITYNPNQQQLMTCGGAGIIQVFKVK